MNERIKELWEKAAESTAAYPSGQNTSWETQVNFMDKFAELIVRECVKIAYQNDIAKFTRDGYQIGMDIQKHFGVEE